MYMVDYTISLERKEDLYFLWGDLYYLIKATIWNEYHMFVNRLYVQTSQVLLESKGDQG